MNTVPPCGKYFFSVKSTHADDQRRVEHAGDAAEPADRDDDQEHHQVFERILRIEAEKLGAEPAAERGHAAAEREGDGEQPRDVDAERFRHAAVVDRGADLRAHAGALEAEPQAEHDDAADPDQHDAVGAVGHEAEIDLALHRRRQRQRLRLRPDDDRHAGDHDEHEADGEQHLVELRRAIELRIERPLEHGADRRGDDEADGERRDERDAELVHRQHDDVAADHGKAAVGEIGKAHQAHGHRQADRDDEQHHAGGKPAEQHIGDFDRSRGGPPNAGVQRHGSRQVHASNPPAGWPGLAVNTRAFRPRLARIVLTRGLATAAEPGIEPMAAARPKQNRRPEGRRSAVCPDACRQRATSARRDRSSAPCRDP